MSSSPSEKEERSEPIWATAFRDSKDEVPYYSPNIEDKITHEIRSILENYSKVPADEVSQHVHNIRDKAWAIRSYPCTGLGAFTTPLISKSPAYDSIVNRLKNGQHFLDIGCFIGHDLRRLMFDGAPSENLYGIDIVSHWDIGYEMFRDRGRFSATFFEDNILYPSEALKSRTFNIIGVSLVIHQWALDDQVAALKNIVHLSAPKATVVGFQVGSLIATDFSYFKFPDKKAFVHDLDSFKAIWERVGNETGTSWICDVSIRAWEDLNITQKEVAYIGKDAGMLQFVVNRVD